MQFILFYCITNVVRSMGIIETNKTSVDNFLAKSGITSKNNDCKIVLPSIRWNKQTIPHIIVQTGNWDSTGISSQHQNEKKYNKRNMEKEMNQKPVFGVSIFLAFFPLWAVSKYLCNFQFSTAAKAPKVLYTFKLKYITMIFGSW